MKIFVSWFPDAPLIGSVDLLHAPDAGRGARRRILVRQEPRENARRVEQPVTFADVAGCEEGEGRVGKLVEFLRDPRNSRSSEDASRVAC